jgi:uncharacterized Fe-S cluster protein YjdI
MKDIIKKYNNGEVTVIWQPGLCIHSAHCVKGLPAVFNTTLKPWIDVSKADTEALVNQIKQCPSGALSYIRNREIKQIKG